LETESHYKLHQVAAAARILPQGICVSLSSFASVTDRYPLSCCSFCRGKRSKKRFHHHCRVFKPRFKFQNPKTIFQIASFFPPGRGDLRSEGRTKRASHIYKERLESTNGIPQDQARYWWRYWEATTATCTKMTKALGATSPIWCHPAHDHAVTLGTKNPQHALPGHFRTKKTWLWDHARYCYGHKVSVWSDYHDSIECV
jgi:hypothetical protein